MKPPGTWEMVLRPGTEIIITREGETLRISAGEGLQRSLRWNDCAQEAKLHPRGSRWYGALGAYAAGPYSSLQGQACGQIAGPVVGEAQIHFNDLNVLQEWLRRFPGSHKRVWNQDGVVVTWAVNPARGQFGLDINLLCLNGKPYVPPVAASMGSLSLSQQPSSAFENCAQVGEEDYKITRRQLEAWWRELDALPARFKGQ